MGSKKSSWNPFNDVGSFVEKTVTSVGKTVENVIKNPLPVIETIALTAMGVPAPIASAVVTGMNGGTPEQMLKAAVASSVPMMGEAISTQLGVSVVTGNVLAGTAVSVAFGVPLDQAVGNGIIAGAVAGSKPYISSTVNGLLNDPEALLNSPAVADAVTNAALAAEAGVLHGDSSDKIASAVAASLSTSAIQETVNYLKPSSKVIPLRQPGEITSTELAPLGEAPLTPAQIIGANPLASVDFSIPVDQAAMSSAIALAGGAGNTQDKTAPVSPLDAATEAAPEVPPQSALDIAPEVAPEATLEAPPKASSESPLSSLPEAAPEYFAYPKDTSVDANYAIDSTLTPKPGVDPATGTGMTVSPLTTGADNVGYGAVDYSIYDPASVTGDPSLQMPESSNIKSMGGGQGLTADVTNPVTGEQGTVGELGYTAKGAIPVSDPAYLNSLAKKLSVIDGTSFGGNLTRASAGAAAGQGSTSSPLNAPEVAESYLKTRMVNGQELTLAQLKQLYPDVVPELSKLLIDRGMSLTPAQQEVNFGDFPQNAPSGSGSGNLNAVEFANFGQPSEDYQYAAKGGSMKLPKGHKPEFITGQTGHYAQGRGTGQSDDIPAVLRDGDYVVDADTVAAFGDGSSKAGAGALERFRRSLPEHMSGGGQPIPAKIADGEYVLPAGFVTSLGKGSNKQGAKMLDAMREQIRAHKRSAPDTKIPPKARSPLQYMNEAMKG